MTSENPAKGMQMRARAVLCLGETQSAVFAADGKAR